MKTYLFVYSCTTLIAMALTPFVIYLCRRLNLTDMPGPRKVHSEPVPRIGGVAVYAAAMCIILPLLFLPDGIGDEFRAIRPKLCVLLCAATGIFAVGLIDDIKHLSASKKLCAQIIFAMLVCSSGVCIKSIAVGDWLTIHFGWLSWPLTILWIVGIVNAVNLSDGLDGLAAGVSAIACAIIAVFAISSGQMVMAVLMLSLLGSLTGFLCYNFNPAKIFLGDSGSMLLGFLVSGSSVMCHMKYQTFVGLALPALALGIPIFDTLFSMLRRFLSRRSIFAPDRSHFHHRLLRLGLRQRHAVIIIYIVTVLITGLGMFMIITRGGATAIIFCSIVILLLVLFRIVGSVHLRETIAGLQQRFNLSRQTHAEMRSFEHLQLQFDEAGTMSNWWQALCNAAHQLDFAWVSLKTTDSEGNISTFIWRMPGFKIDFNNIIIMNVPIRTRHRDETIEFEVAAYRNGSLEAACRRVSLFGRLIDEHNVPPIRSCMQDRLSSANTAQMTSPSGRVEIPVI